MNQDGAQPWLLTAFGDLELGVWGVAVGGEQPRLAVSAIGTDGSSSPDFEPVAATPGADGSWTLSTEAHSLTVAGTDPASTPLARTAEHQGELELCTLTGTLTLDGEPREVALAGLTCSAPSRRFHSMRVIGAWFPTGRALGLLASRPKEDRPDRDELEVAVGGEEQPLEVFDPRLSTTYDGRGLPLRTGVELWLGADEDSDQYPLRLAGESTGSRATAAQGDLTLQASGLRCHNRGDDGAGVYVLLRRG